MEISEQRQVLRSDSYNQETDLANAIFDLANAMLQFPPSPSQSSDLYNQETDLANTIFNLANAILLFPSPPPTTLLTFAESNNNFDHEVPQVPEYPTPMDIDSTDSFTPIAEAPALSAPVHAPASPRKRKFNCMTGILRAESCPPSKKIRFN
jgi:hypothetical protein